MSVNFPYKSVLDAPPFALSEEEKHPLFKENLLAELIHHFDNNEMYRKFCQKNEFDPHQFSGEITEIPPIPVAIFKRLGGRLSSVNQASIKGALQSSATSGIPSTILLDKITARRQTKAMARVIQEVLGSKRRPFCIMDIDPTSSQSAQLGARGAAVRGYLNFASSAHFFIQADEQNSTLSFSEKAFVEYLNTLNTSDPLVIFGFTFVLYQTVFLPLKKRGVQFQLPRGSQVIHIGGWKKIRIRKSR